MNRPKLSVIIHTEEEFDWNGGFFASNNAINHGKELTDFCEKLIAIGAHIVFAMDYAFVSSEQGKQVIQHFKQKHANQVEFATHLHPWVNPPFAAEDQVSEKYSYPGNLPLEDEKQKLTLLTEAIEAQAGYRPTTYLAGRYGVGENTYKILQELGYKVDLSITPFTDYGYQEGPNFANYANEEVTIDGIRCIPHSSGYVSYLPSFTDYLNRKAGNLEQLNSNIPGKIILKLLGVKRVRLSPEGFNAREMQQLSDSLVRIGVKHLLFSFHSPTVKVGITPYTQTEDALSDFEASTLDYLRAAKNVNFCLVHNLQNVESAAK